MLERYCLAANHFNVGNIIRATGDNPLVSPRLANLILTIHKEKGADLSHLVGMPLGTGIEVIKKEALIQAGKEAEDPKMVGIGHRIQQARDIGIERSL